jgi:signal transduction histidine kinase
VNLLDNAVLASAADEPVNVFATLDRSRLQITITDRGFGMEPSVAALAFEPGFTTREGAGGSGIGLTVSREIVESLGGTIELRSEAGAGTVAQVRLPLEGGTST